jgi:hypothetical protein
MKSGESFASCPALILAVKFSIVSSCREEGDFFRRSGGWRRSGRGGGGGWSERENFRSRRSIAFWVHCATRCSFAIYLLYAVGTEEGVLLQSGLIFNDGHGHAQLFEGAHGEPEDFGLPSRVGVVDEGLAGDVEGLSDARETRAGVHRLDVGFSLSGRGRQGRGPHAVELDVLATDIDLHGLGDDARQAIVRLQNAHDALVFICIQQASKDGETVTW